MRQHAAMVTRRGLQAGQTERNATNSLPPRNETNSLPASKVRRHAIDEAHADSGDSNRSSRGPAIGFELVDGRCGRGSRPERSSVSWWCWARRRSSLLAQISGRYRKRDT
jgi:hypothetical protein